MEDRIQIFRSALRRDEVEPHAQTIGTAGRQRSVDLLRKGTEIEGYRTAGGHPDIIKSQLKQGILSSRTIRTGRTPGRTPGKETQKGIAGHIPGGGGAELGPDSPAVALIEAGRRHKRQLERQSDQNGFAYARAIHIPVVGIELHRIAGQTVRAVERETQIPVRIRPQARLEAQAAEERTAKFRIQKLIVHQLERNGLLLERLLNAIIDYSPFLKGSSVSKDSPARKGLGHRIHRHNARRKPVAAAALSAEGIESEIWYIFLRRRPAVRHNRLGGKVEHRCGDFASDTAAKVYATVRRRQPLPLQRNEAQVHCLRLARAPVAEGLLAGSTVAEIEYAQPDHIGIGILPLPGQVFHSSPVPAFS